MRSTYKFLGLVALVFLLCNKALAAPSMSDGEAKKLIEKDWNSSSFVVLPLGTFKVVREGFSNEVGFISNNAHESLIAWAKAGVVSINYDQEFENFKKGKTTGGYRWDWYNEMTSRGLSAIITVTPTSTGAQLIDKENPKRIKFLQGNFIVTNVVKNEARKKGVDDYRLVMVAYTAQWNKLLKQYSQIIGKPLAEKRKAIVLFKWDPFSSKWKRVANDVANANEEFKTRKTADALR